MALVKKEAKMLKKHKYTYYIEPSINQLLKKAAERSKCSKGRFIELLVERYLIDRLKILTEEAKYHNDEMIKRHKEINRLKDLQKEEEDKKKKL